MDSAIRAITWTYDSEGRVQYLTTHTDTTPDTSTWTDAANQIKYTFNAAGKMTKEEQEEDGAVDGSTKYVEYGYGTDYSTGNYNRLNWVKYPDTRKIWNGYTHSDTSGTFQDTINDAFNRVGQIAKDNSGSKGDILAEYDFVGMSRMVRRVHDEDTGKYGNDTKLDLWQDTAGDYKGLDRFGRIIDMKFTDFSGSPVDFGRLKYTYDRDSNRLSIEDVVTKANSQSFTYDNLNRLTDAKRGILDSGNAVQKSDVAENFNMDLLGNFTSTAGGIKINSTGTSTVTHAVNATNEITTLGIPNASGAPKRINEPFTSSLSSFWSANKGTWSISANQVNVDTLTSSEAVLLADSTLDIITYEAKVTFPASSSTNKAGLVFAHDGTNSYYAVVLNRNTGKLALYKITSGSWGSVLADTVATFADSTQYTLKVLRRQSNVEAWVVGITTTNLNYNSSSDLGTGKSGLYSDKTNVLFDDFTAIDGSARDPMVPRMGGTAEMFLTSGVLQVNGSTRGGVATVNKFTDGVYMVGTLDSGRGPCPLMLRITTRSVRPVSRAGVYIDRNGGDSDIWIHYQDPNNGYRVRFNSIDEIWVDKVVNGTWTNIASNAVDGGTLVTVGVKYLTGPNRIVVYKNGVQKVSVNDSSLASGGVALGGGTAKFDNLKVGYDNNSDNDLDDVGDDLAVSETFASGDTTIAYDKAGNLIDDGAVQNQYDAWNHLVKVRSAKTTNPTIQTAEFDGLGRRIKKVVTNSQSLDGTWVFFYEGQKIIETRDGSGNLLQQFIHGTRYIDELVQMRVKDKGDLYVHQDANWNVTALTDLGGSVVERYVYTPYGELTVHQDTSYGDRDGDGDVDSTDKGAVGSTCTGTVTGACRILDLDFDGDYDSTDATKFDALPQGLARHPGRTSTGVDQPFGHQGLLYDADVASYQNRARQYPPTMRRFAQRDPLGMHSYPIDVRRSYVDGLNLYSYLRASPLNFTDAQGLVCGNRRWDPYIPDTGIGGADFAPCCQEHDDCYDTCGRSKSWCDRGFLLCLYRQCNKRCTVSWIIRTLCRIQAELYYIAVRDSRGAQRSYQDGQANCRGNPPPPLPPPIPPKPPSIGPAPQPPPPVQVVPKPPKMPGSAGKVCPPGA